MTLAQRFGLAVLLTLALAGNDVATADEKPAEPPPPPADAPADRPTDPMGLARAIEFAIAHSGLVNSARFGTAEFQAKLEQADATAHPKVEFRTLLAPMPERVGGPGDARTNWDTWGMLSYTTIEGYVPVYTFNKISNLRAAAALGVDVGKAPEAIARAEVRFRVQKAFFGLSLAREIDGIIREGRGYLDTARKHVEELEKSDDPSYDPVDKMKVRVYQAQVQGKDLEARRTLALAEGALKLAMGVSPETAMAFRVGEPRAVTPREDPDLRTLQERAMEGRPELAALRTGVKARMAELAARKSNFWPDVVLAGQFKVGYSDVYHRTGVDSINDWTGGLGLALRWDLDIGRKLGEMHETQAKLRRIESDLAEAERGVRLEVEKLWREMRDARELIAAQSDALKASRAWVIAKTDLYENGLADLNDVTIGLVQFFQSRQDYLKAIYDYNVAVAGLERATGVALVPEELPRDGDDAVPAAAPIPAAAPE